MRRHLRSVVKRFVSASTKPARRTRRAGFSPRLLQCEPLEARQLLAVTVGFLDSAANVGEAAISLGPMLAINGTLTSPSTIDVNVTGGSAVAGLDYVNAATVTIPAGTYDGTSATALPINLLPLSDRRLEGDESIDLQLANPGSEVTIDDTNNAMTLVIEDDETATIDFQADGTVDEGGREASIAVTLLITPSGSVGAVGLDDALSVTIQDTGTGSATPGTDYTADYQPYSPPTQTFAVGNFTEQTLAATTVTILDDFYDDDAETVILRLTSLSTWASDYVALDSDRALTIVDDDSATAVSYTMPTAGTYTLVRDGGDIELRNGTGTLVAIVPASTGASVTIQGSSGTDTLVLDFSGGDTVPANGVAFHGNEPDAGPGDSLRLMNSSTDTSTYTFYDEHSGMIELAGSSDGTITYTGLEPIVDNMDVVNRVFTFTGGSETIALASDTSGSNKIDSTLGESVVFANPSASLTINAGGGADTVTIASIDSSFRAALTIKGDAANDVVNLNAALTLGSLPDIRDLRVAAETINLNADITTTGNQVYDGAVTLGADTTTLTGHDITFASRVDADSDALSRALVVRGSGVTTFDGAVGGNQRLESLLTDAAGSTEINGGLVKTVAQQTYKDPVTLGHDAELRAGGNVTFSSTLDDDDPTAWYDAAKAHSIDAAMAIFAGGVVTFSQPVGGIAPLTSLAVTNNGPMTIAQDINVIGDDTSVGDVSLVVRDTDQTTDDLVVESTIRSVLNPGTKETGSVTLQAGDTLTLAESGRVQIDSGADNEADSSVTLNLGVRGSVDDLYVDTGSDGTPDSYIDGDGLLLGTIVCTNRVNVFGYLANDRLTIASSAVLPAAGLRFDGLSRFDTLRFEGSARKDIFCVTDQDRSVADPTDPLGTAPGVVRWKEVWQEGPVEMSYVHPNTLYQRVETVQLITGGTTGEVTPENQNRDYATFNMTNTRTTVFEMDARADGGFKVVGTGASDRIRVGELTSDERFRITGVAILQMFGGGGDDIMINNTAVPSLLDGGDGDDTLYGGSDTDIILGGAGRDKLYGRAGTDYLFSDHQYDKNGPPYIVPSTVVDNEILEGGDGDDWLIFLGNDRLNAGGGVHETIVGIGGRISPMDWLRARILSNTDTVINDLENDVEVNLGDTLLKPFPKCT